MKVIKRDGTEEDVSFDKVITRNINLVYLYKKSQKAKNTANELISLKKRHIVENVFAWLKTIVDYNYDTTRNKMHFYNLLVWAVSI